MNKTLIAIVMTVALAVGTVCNAADANQMKYLSLLSPVVSASEAGAAIDLASYKGNSTVLVNWGACADTNYVGTVTISHANASTGTYSTVTNTAGTAAVLTASGVGTNVVSTYSIDSARLRKYIKATLTQTPSTNAVGVVFIAPMKSE
jgi:hypothetical protein